MTRIFTYDTTLRDGSQGEGVNFSLQDKLLITQRLDELGVDFIEGGYPLSNPKDFEYFHEVRKLKLRQAKVVAFGMTRRKGVKPEDDTCIRALLDSLAPVVTIVGKTWDLHVEKVLGATLDENLQMITDSLRCCVSAGREVFYDAEHFFDGYKRNPTYALQTLRAASAGGATVLILCDTNGGTLPEEVADIVSKVKQQVEVPLGIHCHNDGDLATANSLAAVYHGATQVQGTVNGIGERCGNADLVCVLANLSLKKQYTVLQPGSLARLTELSRYVYEIANMNYRSNQPFVGASAFAHKGGMHTHAIAKSPVTYEHIDPALVGNERRILVSELSGRATILAKSRSKNLSAEEVTKILSRVQDLEHEGYEFEAADASFALLEHKVLGNYQAKFERLGYRVNIEAGAIGAPITEATVKLRVGSVVMHTASEGDGPVNALDGALRKALLPVYPTLRDLHLADFKVRVVNAGAETAARVRVVIEWLDKATGLVWGTVGVSENIVAASWLALVDAMEYKLGAEAILV